MSKDKKTYRFLIVLEAMVYGKDRQHLEVGFPLDLQDGDDFMEEAEKQKWAKYMIGIGRCADATADEFKAAKSEFAKAQKAREQAEGESAAMTAAIEAAKAEAEARVRAELAAKKAQG
jgi:flavodoxin